MRNFLNIDSAKFGTIFMIGSGVILSAYYIFRRHKNEQDKTESAEELLLEVNPHLTFIKSAEYLKNVESMKTILKLTNNAIEDPTMLAAIIKTIIELYKSKFNIIYLQNRNLRRQKINDRIQYAKLMADGTRILESLFEEASAETMRDIGIDPNYYYQAYEVICKKEPQFSMYAASLCDQLKIKIESGRKEEITRQDFMNYFQVQIDEIDKGSCDRFDDLNAKESMLYKLCFLSDIASMKLGIEEEDLAKQIQRFDNDVKKKQEEFKSRLMGRTRQKSVKDTKKKEVKKQ